MNRYLADTTLFIELLRGNQKAKDFITKSPNISVVTVAEVIQGCRNSHELRIIEKVCENINQEKINNSISQMALDLVKEHFLSHRLFFLDALIAATAITNHLILVTENVKDFRFIPDLKTLSHSEAFKKA